MAVNDEKGMIAMKTLKTMGRFLCWDDGSPFFYLADTAWELMHNLSREEMEHYFAVRARQGFTAVQSVVLAEKEGLTVPNFYGRLPLRFAGGLPDPTQPDLGGDYSYWAHVDFAVQEAARQGLFVVLLPTWGDKFNMKWGLGPEIFTPENAYIYAKWMADRYRGCWNIIWMLGGDRPLENDTHRAVIDAMAKGIREVDANHLITFHPTGGTVSTQYLPDAEYIDFHTAQTGHRTPLCYASDGAMRLMAAASPKPYLDSEPRYEDHPACFNERLGYYWNADDVRQNAYWDVLAGACGHTYGNHCVWSMTRKPTAYYPFIWSEVLEHPGARQMGFVRKLRLARDYFSLRPAPELLKDDFAGMCHMAAARGNGYAYVYSPLGVPFTVNLSGFEPAGELRALWFDPRTGEETLFAILPAQGQTLVVPPAQGKGNDWVLVLEVGLPRIK